MNDLFEDRFGKLLGCTAAAVLIAAGFLVVTSVQRGREAAVASASQGPLNQLQLAFLNYHDTYGSFPPAYIADKEGRPMHSWRVLILPYLGEKRLYEAYDFSKPWNAPENSSLQGRIPGVYVSPASTKAGVVGESSYMLITGPRTLFPPARPVARNAIGDGAENTLLVVETNNATLPWVDPSDLDVTILPASIGLLGGIGGSHAGGATVAFADGEARWLPSDTTKSVIDGLITPNGGEAVRGAWFR